MAAAEAVAAASVVAVAGIDVQTEQYTVVVVELLPVQMSIFNVSY